MKQLYLVSLSLVLTLQLVGCTNTQPVSSTAVSSIPQPPAQSSYAPATPISEQPVTKEPKTLPEQQIPSVMETTSQPAVAQPPTSEQSAASEPMEENNMLGITIQVDGRDFSATLVNSEAALAFVKYFPMTVQMSDLNRQEKFYDLPEDLPAASTESPSTIYSGEIMCWSGNTLVLFYSTFQNSYSGYVRLGTVDDPDGLAAVLGSGSSVEATWALT